MKRRRLIVVSLALASTVVLGSCSSKQMDTSLTTNINYSLSAAEGVKESSVTVKYKKDITGPSVLVEGKLEYLPAYESKAPDLYKKNLRTIAVLVQDIGGISDGKVEVVGQVGKTELIPGIVKGSDKKSVSLKDLLPE